MRLKISFISKDPVILPVHYNYIIQSFIYNNLSKEFSDFLHNQGFKLGSRSFKLFTFSRLLGKFEMLPQQKIKIFSPFDIIVSSPVDKFIRDFASSLMKNDNFSFLGQRIEVQNISVISELDRLEGNIEILIKMLSPVVVYKTFMNGSDKKTYYFSPEEEKFSKLIKENLLKKAELLQLNNIENIDLKISPVYEMNQNYCKIIKYKGTVIKGWMGIYRIQTDTKLFKVAYDSGLGSKNSQGFGCFEIVKE
ncbi:CRISPR-associated endoribonuclease Cas6 [Thermovenabulum sp.]|uniref:CRISPR-associated endoribonuclease Cas6 n=1 Tax=Thermovenabulum sp. TaxID=3100335 RepID=UPI003C7C9C1E